MNIGQASKASGVSAKMIRYYEEIGLLPKAGRRESGYRDYAPADLHRLSFVRRARELGFPIERIRTLLTLWSDRDRSNADVRGVALSQIADLEEQEAKLRTMIGALRQLVRSCARDRRPDCPIIAELSGEARPVPRPKRGRACH